MKYFVKTLLSFTFLICSLLTFGQDKDFELDTEESLAISWRNSANAAKAEVMRNDRQKYEEIKTYHSNGKLALLAYKNLKTGAWEGTYENYYESGNPKIFGFLVKDNKWSGLHREFYSNGQQRIAGQFDDEGRKTGIWEYHTENGDWYRIDKYRDGRLKATANLRPDGTFDGEKKTYYDNGKLSVALNYSNGKLDGQQRSYYAEGQLKAVETYRNGEKTEKQTYYDNGSPEFVIPNIRNGNPEGETKEYYKNGKLKAVCYWVNGKLNGEVRLYKETGELDKIERYKDDKKID